VPDSTVEALDRRYQAGRDVRRVFENDWTLQLAFGLGHQWVGVDSSGRLFEVGAPQERVTLTDNRIRPATRTNIARKTKAKPSWSGIPKNRTDEEIQRARIRSDVFDHYWRELELTRRLRLALWYVEHTGKGFWKIVWDGTKGPRETVVAIKGGDVLLAGGQPVNTQRVRSVLGQLSPEQQADVVPRLEDREVTHGDVDVTLKTPFEIVVDPLATDEGLISAEYIVEEALHSPARLRKLFPQSAHLIGDEDGSPTAGTLEGRFPGMNSYLERSRERRGAPGRRGVKVREYWSLPGVDGPEGKHVVWLVNGEKVLLEEDNPYPFLPYADFTGLSAGRFWADAPIKDLISPQTERNKVKSQIAENAERFGNPARMRSAESRGLDMDDWQGLPGEEVVYHDVGTPGAIPQFLVPPEMPGYVAQQLVENEASIARIVGQNEVAQGTVPEGVTAASAISQLIEQNDTMIGPDIDDMGISLLDAGKKLLWCVRKFAKDDRLARIAGEDSGWDVTAFTGEALGDADGDAVTIGSTISQSVAVKQAAIQWVINTLIQNGQAPPPRELRRIMRDYEVGGLEHLFGSISRTQTQVVEEHRRMMQVAAQLPPQTAQLVQAAQAQGAPVPPLFPTNTYDDDQVHVEEHVDFQRGSRYSQEVERNPMFGVVMEQHVAEHRQKLQDAANNAAAARMIEADPGGAPTLDPASLNGGQDAAQGAAPGGALPSPAGEPSPNGA
jgi:hypothetical protein